MLQLKSKDLAIVLVKYSASRLKPICMIMDGSMVDASLYWPLWDVDATHMI